MSSTALSVDLLVVMALLLCGGCTPQVELAGRGNGGGFAGGKGPVAVPASGTFVIDLPITLQLAAGRNLDLAMAVEKANRAGARADKAMLSIVPDLAAGASFAKQNGLLQDTLGNPVRSKRVAESGGMGAGGLGGGMAGVPGLSLELPLGKAIFAPLATRQDRAAAVAAALAKQHEVMADAAVAYYELVRARASLQLAREVEGAAGKLADSTRAFATAGQGLEADAERAAATHLLRRGQTARAEADLVKRSASLARVLHLPPSVLLVPADRQVAACDLVNPDEPVARMVATALRFRPETEQMRAELAAATHRLQEQKIKPFLPNIAATYSNFDYAAGSGGSTDRRDGREEVAAMIYWKLEGLGFGNAAEAREQEANYRLTKLKEASVLDGIASEVAAVRAETHAQRARLGVAGQASNHARKAYELTAARLQEAQGLPIEALASIQTMAEARQAEVDAVLDYNIAQHRLLAALGHPR